MMRILKWMIILTLVSCKPTQKTTQDASVWQKINIDFRRLDENGLTGPENGKVSVHYEFCIPGNEKHWGEVRKIDPTATLLTVGKGRAACNTGQWLVVGHTHQPSYKKVLYDLGSLDYVKQIDETFWE